ncbi:MAG TPA: tetratricopeptide repeat protein [Bacteroidetes bacterium]|nr:tetratricopeptide repeat protein [Bacteroidota bacterium]
MLKTIFSSLLFLSCFVIWVLPVGAQPGSTSEGEVDLVATFIEGNREKLLGNWDEALEKFEEVLEHDRDNAATAYEMARVYEAKKDLESAEKYARKAVAWDGENEWYRLYLADVFQKNGKDELAAEQYGELVKLQPHNEEFYKKWAYYLVRSSKPKEAIEVYDRLEAKMGITEDVIRHKHTLYMGMGDHKMAAAELERLVQKFPNSTAYLHLLATFREQTGEKKKAKEIYRKILEKDPTDARAKIALAEETKGNDRVLFLNSLKPVFEDPGTDLDTKIKEIIPYVKELANTGDKNLGTTLLALTSVLKTVHSDKAKAHSVMADVLYYSGRQNEALKEYQKTLELDDTKWPVWEQLLYIYADKKDFQKLVETSDDALDIFPNQATAFYLNGLGLNGLGKYGDALSSLQQALMVAARNARLKYDALIEMGKAYYHLKKYGKSNDAFEKALKINDNDPAVLKNYSYYLAARGEDLDKAKDLAARLNKAAPHHYVSEGAMAFVFYKMKDYPAAKEWLDLALQHGGNDDPAILEYYGDTLYQMGDTSGALQYWQQALDKGGDSELLKKKVREGKMVK